MDSGVIKNIKAKLKGFIRPLFPLYANCLCCHEKRLPPSPNHLCPQCNNLLEKEFDLDLYKQIKHIDMVYAPYAYDGRALLIIHKLKYGCVKEGAVPLAIGIAKRLPNNNIFDCIVPVPLHKSRERQRGFNQSYIIGEQLSKTINIPCCDAMARIKKTKQQTRLSREKRLLNTKDAFAVLHKEDVREKRILLLDDVCTTGATASACSQALLEAGAREVSLCVGAMAVLSE